MPFTLKSQPLIFPVSASKLKALLREKLVVPFGTVVKVPTPYIVVPHSTSCRIFIVDELVVGRCGVHAAGVVETSPPATAGTAAVAAGILSPTAAIASPARAYPSEVSRHSGGSASGATARCRPHPA